MCGIAGIAGAFDGDRAAGTVQIMLHALARRGPDGEGLERWSGAVLGHRRLAIFDLSDAGKQPMLSPDGRIGVTFNGAIFNFPELRTQLEQRGYRFRSRTDTEVLVHGYDAWGVDGLVERLHGMFAFALWDSRESILYLVRDRLGVKPLLYSQQNGALAFASTAAALEAGGFAADLDSQAVAEYLEYGFVTEERSIYSSVEKVPPAHILRFQNGRLETRRYWHISAPSNDRASFEEAVEETERLFLRAVQLRLEADVPIGALLSGGIDSSLTCWAISHLGGDVTAYTVATPGDEWDESADAAATARELEIRHQILPLDAASAPAVQDLTSAYGEPFACASALGMLAVSKAVKERATVLLTGDGGDDVFLGYPRHRHYAASQQIAKMLPNGAGRTWRSFRRYVPRQGALRRAVHFMDYATGGLGAVASVADGLPYYTARGILGARLRNIPVAWRSLPLSHASARRLLDDYLEQEYKTRFVSEYLTKVDGGTMYYGLEARSPFLDQELWTFASALPYSVRLRKSELKAILREIARRRIGPRVASGKKRGFGIPVQRWIAGRWRPAFEEAFGDSMLAREGWVDSQAVLRALHGVAETQTAPQQLWYLYVLENWMQRRRSSSATLFAHAI
jgi:asparagine synthase (glutamine-hydrolysing)